MSATAHTFQLVLSGGNELSDDLAEAIFLAFEGDADLTSRGGTVTVDFFEWEFSGDVVPELFEIIGKVKRATVGKSSAPVASIHARRLPSDRGQHAVREGRSPSAGARPGRGPAGVAAAHALLDNPSGTCDWGDIELKRVGNRQP